MRVIAGERKGKNLQPVPGQQTRPTTDKVKEALFNRIGPFFDGGYGLDLYAGSGALGIESLSRGLDHMIFVDHHPKAIKTIKANLKQANLSAASEVYRNDCQRALGALHKRGISLVMIFLDPPYFQNDLEDVLQMIADNALLQPEGLIVVEHHQQKLLKDTYGSLYRKSQDTYGGKTVLSIYENDH